MTNGIFLSAQHLAEVKKILNNNLPKNAKVWVFGSRANMKAHKGSDLDLVVDLGRKIPSDLANILYYAFADSNLPFSVDLVDMQTTDGIFRKNIEQNKKQLI